MGDAPEMLPHRLVWYFGQQPSKGWRESKQRPLPVNLPILIRSMPEISPSTRAVALLSGGLDSCVATAQAVAAHGCNVAALHVSYGQRTARREREAFEAIADHYELTQRLVADAAYLSTMGGSSLTDQQESIPGADDESLLPSTYVPFRNAHLLSVAVAWSEVLGAGEIFCGAHAPDSTYPDTQPRFFEAFQHLLDHALPTGTTVRVLAPLLHNDKATIVRRGVDLGAPLHLTWSCYADEDAPCGRCHSCHLRQTGFDAAGIDDPLTSMSDFSPGR